jgi:hypothetical protein
MDNLLALKYVGLVAATDENKQDHLSLVVADVRTPHHTPLPHKLFR